MKVTRQLIFICNGSDCKKSGAKVIGKEVNQACKNEPLKGNCKIIKTKCMDMCKSAPVIIVNDYFLKKASVEKVVQELKKP